MHFRLSYISSFSLKLHGHGWDGIRKDPVNSCYCNFYNSWYVERRALKIVGSFLILEAQNSIRNMRKDGISSNKPFRCNGNLTKLLQGSYEY